MNDQRITARETQRVIKYRAWDKEYNDFSEEPFFRLSISKDGQIYNSDLDKWYQPGERYIIQFFTGLLDKHGKEIYEGDLIRVLDRDWPSGSGDLAEHMLNISAICEVVYDVDGFFLVQRKKGYADESLGKNYGRDIFEVVGNIYTTPELVDPKMIER